MVTKSDYTEQEVQSCYSVLIELMTILGEFRRNIVVVGGTVPFLLFPDSNEKHIGTIDIDIAFNFKKIGTDTYSTILKILKEKGYYQKEGMQPFIFYRDITNEKGEKTTVEVDLLTCEYGGTGKSHRHQVIQDVKARKVRGCDLAFDSFLEVKIDGKLPGGAQNKVTVNVSSFGPFLVMKGMTLWERQKEKDAYDIYYCCKNFPGGIDSLVQEISPLKENKLAKEGFGKIRSKFFDVNSIGPNWVADFLEISNSEERDRIKREAFELVKYLLDKLNIKSFEENEQK
ncbi:MAG: hypothetical protein A2551_08230 [Elusimicrobia bacterium RIFOXYD2_FULL_34_30]|nr:MAG: hypothetical protein A2551_08230 [Elusimicrobia bacterium RIFOXYD2_FULL_34_30]